MGFVSLIVLRALGELYYRLPESLRRAWVASLAAFLYVIGFRKRVIRSNLELAFPGAGRPSLGDAYLHFARLSLEILLLFGPMREFALAQELRGLEHWQAARKKGKGVIFLSSHIGNWEVMAAVGAAKHGMELMLVTKHLKPEWLHRAIERGRARCSVLATYEPRTMKDLLRHLRGNGTVGFVLDQYAGPPLGLRVPFLGVTVGTPTTVALIARRTGAAVVPVVNSRDEGGRFVVELGPEMPLSEENEGSDPSHLLGVDTARMAAIIEADVRRFPKQWLWTHRRFKGDLSPLRKGEWSEGRPRKS